MSHGLSDVTLQSTRHELVLHGLREVTSERQVISHDPSSNANGCNGPKWQEMHRLRLLYNKTIVDLCFGRHGVLLNRVSMMFSVQ